MSEPISRRDLFQKALLSGAGLVVANTSAAAWATEASATPANAITIKTLGTGAADHDWKNLGSPGVRGSTSTLIGGQILIDCGITGYANLARSQVSPDHLTDLVITHSHDDHFRIPEIRKVIDGRTAGKPPLAIWAVPESISRLNRQMPGLFTGHELVPGTAFDIGHFHLTALPANHQLADLSEKALHYLIETPCGNLLYALDGAWMLKQARQLIGKKRLSMIIWDATMSKTGDFRAFEHNDLAMIGLMMESLKTTGCVDARTVCVLDHTARTLRPTDLRQAEQLAADRGWLLANDGMDFQMS